MAKTNTDKTLAELGRYIHILLDGCSVQIKQLSVTHLNPNFTKFSQKEYQVFCDDYRLQFCEHYTDPYIAIDKFIELKNALYS
jgi:hypothetical protein